MNFSQAFALAAMVVTIGATPLAAQTVPVTGGQIEGSTRDGYSAFLGVPYAAAPTGENRWRAPQPVVPWEGVREVKSYGADCAQVPFPLDAAPIRTAPSEDCLFLNVWKPASAKAGDNLPVMVWIHGGGFVNGGSSPAIYSGANFARDGVVFVSFNYRLGRFGFFAHPGLVGEGTGSNFGFLDQISALEWVRANIAGFGGDPARVTVFGESAGGMSIHMLLQSPLARGLFHGAIIESGGGRDRALPMPTMAVAAQRGEAFAPGLSAAELRALPADKVTGNLGMMTMNQPGYSGPMLDGRTILGTPIDGIMAGIYPDVPVIVGANSADGFPFITDKDQIFASFGNDETQARALYDPDGNLPGLLVSTMVSADQGMIEPARAVARALAERGGHVWLYRFDYATPGNAMATAMGGAPHASEIPYFFDTVKDRLGEPVQAEEAGVASVAHRYWVNFAKTGRPDGGGDVPVWPQATGNDTRVQLIGAGNTGHVADPLTVRLDFAEARASQSK